MQNNELYTVITGASKGLGKEIAIQCARHNLNIILVALPDGNLKLLCEHLINEYHIKAKCYEVDLTNKDAIFKLYDWLKINYKINGIVNNAGLGGSFPFEKCSVDYIDDIILLNIRALSLLTRLLIPELIKQRRSHILNIASLAAYSPIPYKTVYPASKAFVYSFSRSLREELRGTSINVCVVTPGPISTNNEVKSSIKKIGFLSRLGVVSAQRIAQISVKAMLNGTGVVVPGFWNKFNLLLIRLVPSFIRLPILKRIYKKEFIN